MEIWINEIIKRKKDEGDIDFVNKFNTYFKKEKHEQLYDLVIKTIRTHIHNMYHMEKIRLLMKCDEFDVNFALAWAITFKKKALIKLFIKKDGNILKGCKYVNLNNRIIDFCINQKIDTNKILQILLKQASDKSKYLSNEPIDSIELKNYIKIFKSLKKYSMDINFKDKNGNTLVYYICVRQTNANIYIQLLLYQSIIDYGFDLNVNIDSLHGSTVYKEWPIFNQIRNGFISIKNNDTIAIESYNNNECIDIIDH